MQIDYIDHMGDDLRVVNTARVSFSKTSDWLEPPRLEVVEELENGAVSCEYKHRGVLKDEDKNLIGFLARGMSKKEYDSLLEALADTSDRTEIEEILKKLDAQEHWGPFASCIVQVRVKAPVYAARQLFKHKVGFAESEVSRRYVDSTPEFYSPEGWRKRPKNRKQGSSNELVDWVTVDSECWHPIDDFVKDARQDSLYTYEMLLESGVAPELARGELPQSMYTEWIWTGSLAAYARVYKQRSDDHAQKESQIVAQRLDEIITPLFPVSWKALTR